MYSVSRQPFSLDVATYRLILRSVAQGGGAKDGNKHPPGKGQSPAGVRHVLRVPTLRDAPLRYAPQGEVGVQPERLNARTVE
jgi:hypothetical protein